MSLIGRRSIPVGLVAVALLVTGGAAVAVTAAYFELKPSPTTAGPGALTLTDDLGRSVTVPGNATRVATLSPSIVDSMVRLGLRERIVAVDCYSPAFGGLDADYSPDQIANWSLTSSMCVQVGPTLDVEALLAAAPSLVLASTIISVAEVEEIQQTYHIPVVMLQPSTLGGVAVDVSLLGEIFHVTAAANTLNAQLQVSLAKAAAVATNLTFNGTPFPTVLVTYSVDPAGSPSPGYFTFGPGTFGESLIELASGTSISANATLPYPILSGDQVLLSDPQKIVYGVGFGVDLSSFQAGPNWDQLGAVSSGATFAMNSNYLTEPDPTMILLGLPQLLAILHPGL